MHFCNNPLGKSSQGQRHCRVKNQRSRAEEGGRGGVILSKKKYPYQLDTHLRLPLSLIGKCCRTWQNTGRGRLDNGNTDPQPPSSSVDMHLGNMWRMADIAYIIYNFLK